MRSSAARHLRRAALVGAALLLGWASSALAMDSASYRTLSAGFVASGGELSSASYRSLGGIALGVGVGSSSSASYQMGAGVEVTHGSSRIRKLAITLGGNGSGSITVSALGLTCTQSCDVFLELGTAVTLQAQASAGSAFSGWGGACFGAGSCSVTMDGAKTVTATFTDTQSPQLTIASPGTITTANQASYSVRGSCSENGRVVSISIGSGTPVLANPTCTAGAYSAGGLNVSALPDGAVAITALHADLAGNTSSVATTVQKLTSASIPVNSSLANQTLPSGAQVFVTRGVLTLGPGLVIPPGADVLLVVGRGVAIAPRVEVSRDASLEIVIDPTLQP